MVIKRSSSGEVATLLQALQDGDAAARETAAARLAVIGTRAVEGLIRVATSAAATSVRAAALGALESTGDSRAIAPALALLDDEGLALPAAGVLRRALDSPRGDEVLDRLAAVALDPQRPERARLAALDALQGLPPKTIAPIWRRLKEDARPAIRAAVAGTGPVLEMEPDSALEAAASGSLPEDPEALKRWLKAASASLPLPVLHRLIEGLRAREAAAPAERAAWMTARAAVHLALAARGSRVALYDLREAIEHEPTVPVEMLAALGQIGDASCLEPIAAAYARASAPAGDGVSSWWRQHLGGAFRTIAGREKLNERHAVVRRIRARWPDAALDLIGPPRR